MPLGTTAEIIAQTFPVLQLALEQSASNSQSDQVLWSDWSWESKSPEPNDATSFHNLASSISEPQISRFEAPSVETSIPQTESIVESQLDSQTESSDAALEQVSTAKTFELLHPQITRKPLGAESPLGNREPLEPIEPSIEADFPVTTTEPAASAEVSIQRDSSEAAVFTPSLEIIDSSATEPERDGILPILSQSLVPQSEPFERLEAEPEPVSSPLIHQPVTFLSDSQSSPQSTSTMLSELHEERDNSRLISKSTEETELSTSSTSAPETNQLSDSADQNSALTDLDKPSDRPTERAVIDLISPAATSLPSTEPTASVTTNQTESPDAQADLPEKASETNLEIPTLIESVNSEQVEEQAKLSISGTPTETPVQLSAEPITLSNTNPTSNLESEFVSLSVDEVTQPDVDQSESLAEPSASIQTDNSTSLLYQIQPTFIENESTSHTPLPDTQTQPVETQLPLLHTTSVELQQTPQSVEQFNIPDMESITASEQAHDEVQAGLLDESGSTSSQKADWIQAKHDSDSQKPLDSEDEVNQVSTVEPRQTMEEFSIEECNAESLTDQQALDLPMPTEANVSRSIMDSVNLQMNDSETLKTPIKSSQADRFTTELSQLDGFATITSTDQTINSTDQTINEQTSQETGDEPQSSGKISSTVADINQANTELPAVQLTFQPMDLESPQLAGEDTIQHQTSDALIQSQSIPDSWSSLSELVGDSVESAPWQETLDSLDTIAQPDSQTNSQNSLVFASHTDSQFKLQPDGLLPSLENTEDKATDEIETDTTDQSMIQARAAPLTAASTNLNPATNSSQSQTPTDEQLDQLASIIYSQLRQQFVVDRERRGEFLSGHSLWLGEFISSSQTAVKNKATTSEGTQKITFEQMPSNAALEKLTTEIYRLLKLQIELDRERNSLYF